jgi:hypothetical protein
LLSASVIASLESWPGELSAGDQAAVISGHRLARDPLPRMLMAI